jgi:hypothetical protein
VTVRIGDGTIRLPPRSTCVRRRDSRGQDYAPAAPGAKGSGGTCAWCARSRGLERGRVQARLVSFCEPGRSCPPVRGCRLHPGAYRAMANPAATSRPGTFSGRVSHEGAERARRGPGHAAEKVMTRCSTRAGGACLCKGPGLRSPGPRDETVGQDDEALLHRCNLVAGEILGRPHALELLIRAAYSGVVYLP